MQRLSDRLRRHASAMARRPPSERDMPARVLSAWAEECARLEDELMALRTPPARRDLSGPYAKRLQTWQNARGLYGDA